MNTDIRTLDQLRNQQTQLWNRRPDILWYGQKGIQMVDHSLVHTRNLVHLADNLLTLLKKRVLLKPAEFLVLHFALWLHDIGHRGNENYQRASEVRDFHGVISGLSLLEDAFRNGSRLYKLPPSIALPVALVSMYHQQSTPFNEIDLTYRLERSALAPCAAELRPKNAKSWMEDLKIGEIEVTDKAIEDFTQVPLSYWHELEHTETEIDLLFVCAFLRILDAVDFRYERVGHEKEEYSRQVCIRKEIERHKKERPSVDSLNRQLRESGKFAVSKLDNYSSRFIECENMRLKEVEKEVDAIFTELDKAGITRKKFRNEYQQWARWVRYLAFLQDQINWYYPLHKSVLNVFFTPVETQGNETAVDLVFEIRTERDIGFAAFCQEIIESISKECGRGFHKLYGGTSVGETLKRSGIIIRAYRFRDLRRRKEWPFVFPTGEPLGQEQPD